MKVKILKKCGLLAILLLVIYFMAPHIRIETVSQHNARIAREESERQNMLAVLLEERKSEQDALTEHPVSENTTFFQDRTEESTTINVTSGKQEKSSKQETKTDKQETVINQSETSKNNIQTESIEEQILTEEKSSTTSYKAGEQENKDTTKPTDKKDTGRETDTDKKTTTVKPSQATTAKEEEQTTKPIAETTTEITTESESENDKYFLVEIQILCTMVMNHEDLSTEVTLPADGVILSTPAAAKEGDTVLDILEYVCGENSISFTNEGSGYGAYISEIAGLKEKDCGAYSGWKYKVNNEIIGMSCDSIYLQEGDVIEWYFSPSIMGG